MEESIKEWLLSCDEIKQDKLYFNYLKGEANTQSFQMLSVYNETDDIVGNKEGTYTLAIIDFRTINNEAVAYDNENFKTIADVRKINDWMKQQIKIGNFPENTDNIEITSLKVPSTPTLAGIDKTGNVALAKYIIELQINYIEYI